MLLPTSDGASKCGSLITIIFTPVSFITVFPSTGNAAITASSKLPIIAKKFFIFNHFMPQMYTKNTQQHSIIYPNNLNPIKNTQPVLFCLNLKVLSLQPK